MDLKLYIKLLRPHHYFKNVFIFAPAFFAFRFEWSIFKILFINFVLFSLMASAIYIINDIGDLEEDKQHPVKKYRPVASGKISVRSATFLSGILIIFSTIGSYLINIKFFYILIFYLFINLLYSFKLKHIAIIDLFIISIGFLLRIFAGSIPLDIHISKWIVINTFVLTLLIGFAKRRDDLILSGEGLKTRKNINDYTLEFLTYAVSVLSGVTIVIYILYTVSTEVIQRFHSEYLYLTSCWVILGIFYFLKIILVDKETSDPVEIFYKDLWIKLILIAWLLTFIILVKFGY